MATIRTQSYDEDIRNLTIKRFILLKKILRVFKEDKEFLKILLEKLEITDIGYFEYNNIDIFLIQIDQILAILSKDYYEELI